MAPSLPFPHDRETARNALANYSTYWREYKYKELYDAAVKIHYGECYSSTFQDKHITFKCHACMKNLNCLSSMEAHHKSSNHTRMIDRYEGNTHYSAIKVKHGIVGPDMSKYVEGRLRDTLRNNRNIIGGHLVEEYRPINKYSYFKCILCGAHGREKDIYHHLVGDKHTHRYVKYRFERLELSIDYSLLREKISNLENNGDFVDIKTITDKSLFPERWDDEKFSYAELRLRYQRMNKLNNSEANCSLSDDSKELVKTASLNAAPELATMVGKLCKTIKESRRPKIIVKEESGPLKVDSSVQVYNEWAVDRLMQRLNFLNHTTDMKDCESLSYEDDRMIFRTMYTVTELLRRTVKELQKRSDNPKALNVAKNNLDSMMKTITHIYAVRWNHDNPDGKKCLDGLGDY